MVAKQSKWASFVTMYSALETIAQSTNLLSSGSASINLKRNCASTRTQHDRTSSSATCKKRKMTFYAFWRYITQGRGDSEKREGI